MDDPGWSSGAWPRAGHGPREGLPPGLVWPARRGVDEGPTPWQCRSGTYRRVGGGLWVPAAVEATPEQRIVEAAAQLPAHGGVTGWGALRWHGASWFDGTGRAGLLPVTVALGTRHTLRPRPTLRVSQEHVPPSQLVRVRGVRVTSAAWSTAFEMRKAASEVDALIAFEMAAFADVVSIEELRGLVDRLLWARQGVQRIRDLLPDLDENSWSPMETFMRRAWREDGFPPVSTNRPVFDLAGRFVGTPDLVDLEGGVYAQYDGALHLAGDVRHADVVTEAAYRRLGLEGATMMAGDLADPAPFLLRVRDAYARAGRRASSERGWAMRTPGWWVPTHTVAHRRALSADQRSRYLRYRSAS